MRALLLFICTLPLKYTIIGRKKQAAFAAFVIALALWGTLAARPWSIYTVFQADGFLKESAYKAVADVEKAFMKSSPSSVSLVIDLLEGSFYSRYVLENNKMVCVDYGPLAGDISLTIKQGIALAFKDCSKSKTMLIFSGHGSGIQELFSWKNEQQGSSYLMQYRERQRRTIFEKVHGVKDDLKEWKSCFNHFPSRELLSTSLLYTCIKWASNNCFSGRKIDIVGFDACSMALIEVAYELSCSARYMVASQEREYKNGWNYKRLIKSILKEMSVQEVVRSVVHDYKIQQSAYEGVAYSLSGIDLRLIDQVVNRIKRVALLSRECALKSSLVRDRFCEVRLKTATRSCNDSFVDLISYCEELIVELSFIPQDKTVQQLLRALKKALLALNVSVPCAVSSPDRFSLRGYSIYFPLLYVPEYETCLCAKRSSWSTFLPTITGRTSE